MAHLRMRAISRTTWRSAGAMMIGLMLALVGCGGGQSQTATATATATLIPIPTTAPTQTPAPSPWTAVTNLNTVASIAPSQWRVQYKTFTGVTTKGATPELWARRSDNFGVTYHSISLPSIPGGTNPTNVQVITGEESPLNPVVYFLTVQTQRRCANNEPCQYQYVTMNGGSSWSALNLPVHGILGVTSDANTGEVTQGQRLYGVVTDVVLASSGVVPPGRLVVSGNGGATWSLADAGIFAAHLWIYNFAASPDGSTTVALAGQNFGTMLPTQNPTLSLWRSDNAGATWKNMGAPPVTFASGLRVATIPATGATAIYLLGSDAKNALRLYASVNGGATWPHSYTFPNSADASGSGATFIGTFADGAVALSSYDNSVQAWSPSDPAPTMIFPGPPGVQFIQGELLTKPASHGVYTVWIISQADDGKLTYYYASAQ